MELEQHIWSGEVHCGGIHILEVPFGCQEIHVFLYLILVIISDFPDKKAFLDPIMVIFVSLFFLKKLGLLYALSYNYMYVDYD